MQLVPLAQIKFLPEFFQQEKRNIIGHLILFVNFEGHIDPESLKINDHAYLKLKTGFTELSKNLDNLQSLFINSIIQSRSSIQFAHKKTNEMYLNV